MLTIGSHLSSSKGYLAMAKEAVRIGANTFQFFTRNPRGGRAKALDMDDIAAFRSFAEESGIDIILAHASYTLNPAAADANLRKFVTETIADDLARLEHTPGNMYNIHPGSHTGRGTEAAIQVIAETFNTVLKPKRSTTLLLEAMSGGGTEVGGCFEEIKAILDAITVSDNIGVCIDTCHVLAAGYDIVNDLDGVLTAFDKVIGLKNLKAMHLNDSMYGLGEHKDRHAKIGEGKIGLDGFGRIINHPALQGIPLYLETPNDTDGWAREIAELKTLYRPAKGRKAAAVKKPAAGKEKR